MYNYVDKNYDVIVPYTHNTAHVIILPLEIIMIIHYTIRLTYNTFNNHLYVRVCTFKVLFIAIFFLLLAVNLVMSLIFLKLSICSYL